MTPFSDCDTVFRDPALCLQKRLDELKRPAYLHRLELVALDLGSSFPLVSRVRAVAGSGNASFGTEGLLWPQLVMDVSYSGHLSMTVSTKVRQQAYRSCSSSSTSP